mgnify:CR=1 FL=1
MSDINLKNIEIILHRKKYYVQLNYTISTFREICKNINSSDISFFLDIEYCDYINNALKNFDGVMDKHIQVCFTSLKNASDFANWLESKILMKKLINQKED